MNIYWTHGSIEKRFPLSEQEPNRGITEHIIDCILNGDCDEYLTEIREAIWDRAQTLIEQDMEEEEDGD